MFLIKGFNGASKSFNEEEMPFVSNICILKNDLDRHPRPQLSSAEP